jgi:hypothetical protein
MTDVKLIWALGRLVGGARSGLSGPSAGFDRVLGVGGDPDHGGYQMGPGDREDQNRYEQKQRQVSSIDLALLDLGLCHVRSLLHDWPNSILRATLVRAWTAGAVSD